MPMNLMKQEGSHNVAEEFRLPTEPSEAVKEPNPADFGLNDCPQQPVKPENMNPNISI